MGAFTLTNGALLGGLALLAAPVIAHLLQRRARRAIVFPSIAFLQATAAQQSRLHKLRRLMLLALRAIALACIVLAFTRPVWWSLGAAAGEQKSATATAFIIDRSLSTSQRVGGGMVFDQLRREAIRRLNELEQGVDLAAVIWAGGETASVFPRLSANLPALAGEISGARPDQGRADFPQAISLAGRLLEPHAGPKRLVILTDRQASNWRPTELIVGDPLRPPPGVEVILPEVSVATESNVALTSPAMQPARPRGETTVEVSATVRNLSDARKVVRVETEWVGGGANVLLGDQQVSLDARQTASLATRGVTPAAGSFPALRWKLTETDALPADNTLWLAAASGRGVPVVIASDDSEEEPGTAAYYLTRALAPFDHQSDSRSDFSPRSVSASRMTSADLADAPVLVLARAGVLRQQTAGAIVEFVQRGGSLFVLAGDGPADRNVQVLDEAASGLLVPWRLLSRIDAPRRSPLVINHGRWNSRWLRDFDEASQLAIREIAFRRVWQAGAPAADAETILTFSNGEPAAGIRHLGNGRCLLLNFSPESTTGDLGKTGTFVALMQMLTSQLVSKNVDRTTFLVGDRLVFEIPDGGAGPFTLVDPDGRSTSVRPTPGTREIATGRASQAGLYRVTDGRGDVAVVAVNLDPRESDLAPMAVNDLLKLIAAEASADDANLPAATNPSNRESGRPLWGGFLLTGLSAIALEMLLLGLWRR